jgi:transcription initiation factor TFIID subunit 11
MSLVSGSGTKKKRARKFKKGENDNSSTVGKPKSDEGKRKRRASTADEEEDEGANMDVQMAAGTLEERKKEMEHRALLTSNLDPAQFSRFEAWRSSKLDPPVVRRVCLFLTLLDWDMLILGRLSTRRFLSLRLRVSFSLSSRWRRYLRAR